VAGGVQWRQPGSGLPHDLLNILEDDLEHDVIPREMQNTIREQAAKRWLAKLAKLNPAHGKGSCTGKAPHKPLLLLCLLDMAEAGEIVSRSLVRTAGLIVRFKSYGAIVIDRWPTRLDVSLPFYHLSTQGFWEALTADMQRATSPETCLVCDLNPEFFELLSDPGFRTKARVVVISKYFSDAEKIALFAGLGLSAEYGSGSPTSGIILQEAVEAAKRKGRSARFAVRIVVEYHHTCALSGYRCMANSGSAIVDAAHIERWSKTQNDDFTNGLALSKNAHWMFDEGLWSVSDQWRILVNSQRFDEHGPESLKLLSFAGRLQFDPKATLRPSMEYLRRHRQYFGFRG
jgi:putative restriction endonuclease